MRAEVFKPGEEPSGWKKKTLQLLQETRATPGRVDEETSGWLTELYQLRHRHGFLADQVARWDVAEDSRGYAVLELTVQDGRKSRPSYRKLVTPPSHHDLVGEALRAAAEVHVQAARIAADGTECEYCSEPLAKPVEVDHAPPATFSCLAREFGYDGELVDDPFTEAPAALPPEEEARWLSYHAEHARLRVLHKRCHSLVTAAQRTEEADTRKREKAETAALQRKEARLAKIADAENGKCDLPALVLRDGTVKTLSLDDAVNVIEFYLGALCLDVETSGYWIGHQHYQLRTIQLGGEDAAVVLDADDPVQREVAGWALKNAVRLHAHSATADLAPCVHAGLIGWDEGWAKMHDSVLYAKLSDPKLTGTEANGLKDLAADLLREYAVSPAAEVAKNALFKAMGCKVNTEVTDPPGANGWYQVDRRAVTMIRYAGSDVLDLAAVLRCLPALPVAESVLDRERKVQAQCAPLALYGADLDEPHIKGLIGQHEKSRAEHQENVRVLSDGKITNPSSPDVGAALIELFPELGGGQMARTLTAELPAFRALDVSEKTGKPSASKKSLAGIPEGSPPWPLAKEILAYRHDVTTLGLLLRPLENLCDQGDGKMRPVVYTLSADTGRMSTVRPNSSQFSKKGGLRASVKAPPGYRGIGVDFTGCEIRVAAGLSGDRKLLEAEMSPFCYKCERDATLEDPCPCGLKTEAGVTEVAGHTGLHWLAAHLTFGQDAVKADRYACKSVIFRKLFGGAPDSEVAQKIASVFDTRIAPDYKAWDDWLRKCWYSGSKVYRDYATGQNFAVDLPGRSRYAIYQTYSGRQIYALKGAHALGNYAIQGTARELLVDALLRWAAGPWGDCVLIPIHDELIAFVPEADAAWATRFLVECMTTDVLSVPTWPVIVGADADEPWVSWPDAA